MSDWADYYSSNAGFLGGLSRIAKLATRDMAGQTHGGSKAVAGMIPGYGYFRRAYNEYRKAEDYYQNSGTDPRYSSDVSNLSTPTLSQVMGGGSLPRMARALTELYTPEILEDVSKRR